MRLTERYMDPPGEAMPDCLIAARFANNMERVLRELGDAKYADQFKGFDWKTEQDAFMDGYAKHEKGHYAANASGRLMGTLASGTLYQLGGLGCCLAGSAVMLVLCWLITLMLPIHVNASVLDRTAPKIAA
jgi:hypothetical protein